MWRLLLLPILLVSQAALTATVYKSVDEKGRVSFSDQPPAAGSPAAGELVEILHYNDPAPTPSPGDAARFEAMREVTERMAADRREREKLRLEARRLELESRAAQLPVEEYYNYGSPWVSHAGYGRIYRRPHYPGVRPPGVRPPIHRPFPVSGPAITSQYPAKLIRRHYTSAAARVFNPGPQNPYYR